jgi:hypothetical protein
MSNQRKYSEEDVANMLIIHHKLITEIYDAKIVTRPSSFEREDYHKDVSKVLIQYNKTIPGSIRRKISKHIRLRETLESIFG